jgi:hypothetical protein
MIFSRSCIERIMASSSADCAVLDKNKGLFKKICG